MVDKNYQCSIQGTDWDFFFIQGLYQLCPATICTLRAVLFQDFNLTRHIIYLLKRFFSGVFKGEIAKETDILLEI